MKRKKCVRRYMARKMWGGLGTLLKGSLFVSLGFAALLGIKYLEVCCPLVWAVIVWAVIGLVGLIILAVIVAGTIGLYQEARRECGYDQD